ncbi:MAG TPA: tetratricopeptide repeat protein [Cyclobacteriaceae bacterium]|nr:tetratricopeptide repeat protein [Cyclobacteriaceae bacterium]
MRIYPILACLLVSVSVFAGPVDSLENVLKTAQGDQKVKTLNELFRAHMNSDPVKAIGYTREALDLATNIGDHKGMAASYNNLGVAYKNQGALDKGLEYYLIALKTYTDLDNKEGIATTKNNIANIYSLKKDYASAMKYFEESEALLTQLDDKSRMIGTMNNLGNLHSDLQLFEQALKYYTDAWQLSEKMGTPSADPLSNIGNLYFRQGNYQRAVEYYERALGMAEKENNKLNILNITANLGEVYVRANQPKKAQDYLDRASALVKEMQATFFEPQILRSMADNFARQGRMKEAYETMVAYDKTKDKVYGEESSRKIAQMEMALDLQEKEKEVEGLRREDEIKSLQLHNTRMIITTVIMGIVIIVAGFNLFFSRRRSIAR